MVDFQSRDTRRGPVDDDEDDEADDPADAEDVAEPVDAEGGTVDADEPADAEDVAEPVGADETADVEGGEADADETVDPEGGTETTDTDPLAEPGESEETTDTDPLAEPGESEETTDTDPLAEPGQPDETGEPEAKMADTATEETAAAAPSIRVNVAVLTVSEDGFGPLEDAVTTAFESTGHTLATIERVQGGYDGVQELVQSLVGQEAVDVVVTVGGTGLTADQVTIEAVHPLLEKALPGFGEAFRSRLASQAGTGVVGVRSTAGVADGTLVFCLPADTGAVTVAVEEILAAEVPVLVDRLGG